ncbi:hypothetical protein [Pedobacter sp. GR22-10]|uniref:hypothetical protein n=1 Tax=Pedobacter sp. GR22-10 TaxID=2994472 RepID=UPI002246EEC0|nr:hypothetical protein [Pedobacter sp. GR22-10]MCX2429675.1 hypothetical protein [Pedobacter sp. GR22-10]
MKTQMKSLADELRKSIGTGEVIPSNKDPVIVAKEKKPDDAKNEAAAAKGRKALDIISRIRDFDCSDQRHLLHPRVDARTVALLGRLKLASGLEMNRVIAFSIVYLFERHPEIKSFIKESLENFE